MMIIQGKIDRNLNSEKHVEFKSRNGIAQSTSSANTVLRSLIIKSGNYPPFNCLSPKKSGQFGPKSKKKSGVSPLDFPNICLLSDIYASLN